MDWYSHNAGQLRVGSTMLRRFESLRDISAAAGTDRRISNHDAGGKTKNAKPAEPWAVPQGDKSVCCQ